jgi:DNA-binding transcriptional LysR family regulator
MSHHGPAVPGLEMLTLERQTILVAVPAGSPLAKKPSVRLGERSGYPFVTARSALTQLDAAIAAACRAAEYVPKVVQYAGQVQALLSLVANNIGVSFVPEKAKHLHVDGVVLKPVDDFPPDVYLDTVVACLAEGASPMVRLFLAEVRQTFGLNEDLGARVELADSAPRRARGADRPATADKI